MTTGHTHTHTKKNAHTHTNTETQQLPVTKSLVVENWVLSQPAQNYIWLLFFVSASCRLPVVLFPQTCCKFLCDIYIYVVEIYVVAWHKPFVSLRRSRSGYHNIKKKMPLLFLQLFHVSQVLHFVIFSLFYVPSWKCILSSLSVQRYWNTFKIQQLWWLNTTLHRSLSFCAVNQRLVKAFDLW